MFIIFVGMSIEVPRDPVALASPIAETGFTDTSFAGSRDDVRDLVQLDEMADSAGLRGGWFVEASRGFITPASFDADEEVQFSVFDGLYFEGDFSCYSRLSIGQFVGRGAVRALCLTFGSGMLVTPTFASLDSSDLLHIPVLSVRTIVRQN